MKYCYCWCLIVGLFWDRILLNWNGVVLYFLQLDLIFMLCLKQGWIAMVECMECTFCTAVSPVNCEWQLPLDFNDLLPGMLQYSYYSRFSLSENILQIFLMLNRIFPAVQWVSLHHLRLDVWRPWNVQGVTLHTGVTAQVWLGCPAVRIKYLRPSCLLLESTQYLLHCASFSCDSSESPLEQI